MAVIPPKKAPPVKAPPVKAPPVKAPPSKAVATVAKSEPPAVTTAGKVSLAMLEQDAASAGQEVLFNKDDLAIPFLRMIQALTPQRKKSESVYIDGAEEGDLFNTVTNELWKGDVGVLVVPAYHTPSYIEWKIREDGGGLVKDWGALPPSILDVCTRDEKNRDITPDGTQIVRSSMYYVLVVEPETGTRQQVAMSLSSTQLAKARKWNSFIAGLTTAHPETGHPMKVKPWFMAYRITAVPEGNDKGSWFGYRIEAEISTLELPQGDDIYLEAARFKDMVAGGEVKAKVEQMAEGGEPAAAADDGKGF